jgi:GNAT superfamily N-acetyltransferase
LQPEVRVATSADLPALVDSLGQERFFAERLGRQRAGRGLLLVAWLAGTPVGDVYLWLEPAEEPELRQRLPGVPLLQHLEVRPGHRNRRIGSALIRTAEQLLADHGHARVALGVHPANHGADRLYRRHGYREWPYPQILTSSEELRPDGTSFRRAELCRILVKDLAVNPADVADFFQRPFG